MRSAEFHGVSTNTDCHAYTCTFDLVLGAFLFLNLQFFYSEAMSSIMKGSTMADAVRDAIINKVSK